jgi:Flp pilus assembly protein TadG
MRVYAIRRMRRSRGMAVMVTALTLLFLIPMVGLAIDGGLAFIVKARMGAALDSAALAAGRGLTTGTTQTAAAESGTTAALNFFSANFPSGYLNTSYVNQTACGGSGQSACANTPAGGYETCNTAVCASFTPNPVGTLSITVNATVNSPTYFMRWIGVNSVAVSATGQATRPNLSIVLVLDKSSSMGGRSTSGMPASLGANPVSCDAMVYNSWQFVQNFSAFDTVAEVSFDSTVSLDYPPSSNFKQTSGSGTLESALGNLTCGGNTNTSGALAMAASVLNYVNQPQAINHIVLFTDGVANAVNSSAFPLRTAFNLPNTLNDWRMGPGLPNNHNLSASTTPTASQNSTNCGGTYMCIMTTCVTSSATTIQGEMSQWSGFAVNGGIVTLEQAFGTDYPYTGTLGSGDASPSLPAGCSGSYTDNGSVQGTIAYIPSVDRFGNSTSGPWGVDSSSGSANYTLNSPDASTTWTNGGTGGIVQQVNPYTAPANAPMSPNNTSTPPGTKNLGGPWGSYTSTGAITAFPGQYPSNTFPSGPFSGHFRPDLPNTVGIVSLNTAYNEAQTLQSNASKGTNPSTYSNPTSKYTVTIDAIYLQGNGGDPIAPYFLQYVTNQQNLQVPSCVYTASTYPYTPTYIANPNYVSGQPAGSYVAVSSSTQLSAAFEQIAGSLLRVTQ